MKKLYLAVTLWDNANQEEIDQLMELFKEPMSVKIA